MHIFACEQPLFCYTAFTCQQNRARPSKVLVLYTGAFAFFLQSHKYVSGCIVIGIIYILVGIICIRNIFWYIGHNSLINAIIQVCDWWHHGIVASVGVLQPQGAGVES